MQYQSVRKRLINATIFVFKACLSNNSIKKSEKAFHMIGDICCASRICKKKKIAQLISANHKTGNLVNNRLRSCSNPLVIIREIQIKIR